MVNLQIKRTFARLNARPVQKAVRLVLQRTFLADFFLGLFLLSSITCAFSLTKKAIPSHGVTPRLFFGHCKRTPDFFKYSLCQINVSLSNPV